MTPRIVAASLGADIVTAWDLMKLSNCPTHCLSWRGVRKSLDNKS